MAAVYPSTNGLGRLNFDVETLDRKTSKRDLKIALKEAGRKQNAVRKSVTFNSEFSAFEQPRARTKEKGVRNAIRRQTRKLKRPDSEHTLCGAGNDAFPSLPPQRSFSFDYGDEEKKGSRHICLAPPTHPRFARGDAKTQLMQLKAEQKQRRAAEKAAEKAKRQVEKAERRELAQRAMHERQRALDYLRALASRHPRQELRNVRNGQRRGYTAPPNAPSYMMPADLSTDESRSSYISHDRNLSGATLDVVSPLSEYAPNFPPRPRSKFWLNWTRSPSPVPHWTDFATPEQLRAYFQSRTSPKPIKEHRAELPAYERTYEQPIYHEAPTEPPEHEEEFENRASSWQLSHCSKPPSTKCDICSASICLSDVFYYCNMCGPRDGGVVCSGCQKDNKKCLGNLHDLESSIQLVEKLAPKATPPAQKNNLLKRANASRLASKPEEVNALMTISKEAETHSLSLATMQKKLTKLEAGMEKTAERLDYLLEDSKSQREDTKSQREDTLEQTRLLFEELKAERTENLNTIKRLSTKRKPRRQSSLQSTDLVHMSREKVKEREMALRERDLVLKERAMALEERREAAMERAERSTPQKNVLPSQTLSNAPAQDSRLMLDVMNKLNRIEGISAMSLRQLPSLRDKAVEQVVEQALGRLSLVESGIREHAGVKRKADSSGANNSIQSTPTTGISPSSFLQPPLRQKFGGRQDDEEEDGHSPKRPRSQPAKTPEPTPARLLACPYSKFDFNRYSHRNVNEQNYRGCSSCFLTDISRLKQHLYRVHQQPKYHCPRCFEVYKNQQLLGIHIREGGCQQMECPFPEKFADDSQLRRKWPGKSLAESWYTIYRVLFPGLRVPASPYAEDLATPANAGLSNQNGLLQPPSPLSMSPEAIRELSERLIREQLERGPMPLSSSSPEQAHAFLFSLARNVATETLRFISASPTPITNSNPSSAALPSGAFGSSPGPESALPPVSDDMVDPNLSAIGKGTMNSMFGNGQDLCDLSLGQDITVSAPTPAMANPSIQSSGTFSNLGSLPGAGDLLQFEEDLVLLEEGESSAAAVKASNSKRSIDSGYGSLLRNEGVLGGSDGTGTGTGTGTGSGISSTDSLLDPETYEKLMQEHGEGLGFDLQLGLGLGFM